MNERLSTLLNSLTAKYVAVFVLLVTVPSLAVAAYTLSSSYDREKRDLVRLQQEKASHLARVIDDKLSSHPKPPWRTSCNSFGQPTRVSATSCTSTRDSASAPTRARN